MPETSTLTLLLYSTGQSYRVHSDSRRGWWQSHIAAEHVNQGIAVQPLWEDNFP
jgi:hypothetical protein